MGILAGIWLVYMGLVAYLAMGQQCNIGHHSEAEQGKEQRIHAAPTIIKGSWHILACEYG